jgi:hypothetical protein
MGAAAQLVVALATPSAALAATGPTPTSMASAATTAATMSSGGACGLNGVRAAAAGPQSAAGQQATTSRTWAQPNLADVHDAATGGAGYRLAAADGGIFAYGDAGYYGSMGGKHLNQPIVGLATTPDGNGYWEVAADGGIFAYGDAGYYGSQHQPPARPVVGLATTADGHGYWEVSADGGVYAFGDAGYHGSTGGAALSHRVVGIAATADGEGYWLVSADGGVSSFGDATFFGAMGGQPLAKPVVALAPDPAASPGTPQTAPAHATTPTTTTPAASGSPSTTPPTGSGAPATPATTPIPTTVPVANCLSANWSGYDARSGPFSAVTGTFTVPKLATTAVTPEQTAMWVGIGGVGDTTETDLIQAGVDEWPDPNQAGYFYVEPWWEVLPAAATAVPQLLILAGDQMTVTISQVSGSQWSIQIVDDTTAQRFQTDQSYTGKAASAEWIVEAPSQGASFTVQPLAPFGPNVEFSSLGVAGSVTNLDRDVIVQNSAPVAVPSSLDAVGFQVASGATTPAAP